MQWQKGIADLPGLGESAIEQLAKGKYKNISTKVTHISQITEHVLSKLPLATQLALTYLDGFDYSREELEEFKTKYLAKLKSILRAKEVHLVGSYRRKKARSGDADIVAVECKSISIPETSTIKIVNMGNKKCRILCKLHARWIPCDIAFATSETKWFSILHYTGSKEFNIHMAKHAKANGFKLNEYSLTKKGVKIHVNSEKEIFKKIGMEYHPPTDRVR